jgi:hypothetical protein
MADRPLLGKPDIGADMAAGPSLTRSRQLSVGLRKHRYVRFPTLLQTFRRQPIISFGNPVPSGTLMSIIGSGSA